MADVNATSEADEPIVVGPMDPKDEAVIKTLVAALVAGDFKAFTADATSPRRDMIPPEQREVLLARERAAFQRFMRRVAPVPAAIRVHTGFSDTRMITVHLRVAGSPTEGADLAVVRRGAHLVMVQLHPGLAEHPMPPPDRLRLEALVAALVAGDWPSYCRLAQSERIPDEHLRVQFDLFAYKVGTLKRVQCRVNAMGQRNILALLGPREPGGSDLILSATAAGHGDDVTFIASVLEEQGFDRAAFEKSRRRVANRKSPPLPPWKAHPEIPRYSIGWRMGYGETSALHFLEFFEELSDPEKDRFEQAYPETGEWIGYYRMLRRGADTGDEPR